MPPKRAAVGASRKSSKRVQLWHIEALRQGLSPTTDRLIDQRSGRRLHAGYKAFGQKRVPIVGVDLATAEYVPGILARRDLEPPAILSNIRIGVEESCGGGSSLRPRILGESGRNRCDLKDNRQPKTGENALV